MLDQLVQGKGSETERRILKCLVVARQSSAPARGGAER
jgi:LacI family transcriptional regulator